MPVLKKKKKQTVFFSVQSTWPSLFPHLYFLPSPLLDTSRFPINSCLFAHALNSIRYDCCLPAAFMFPSCLWSKLLQRSASSGPFCCFVIKKSITQTMAEVVLEMKMKTHLIAGSKVSRNCFSNTPSGPSLGMQKSSVLVNSTNNRTPRKCSCGFIWETF